MASHDRQWKGTDHVSGHALWHGWVGLNCRFLLPSTAHRSPRGDHPLGQSEPLTNISLRYLKPPKEIQEILFWGLRLQLQFQVPVFMTAVNLQSWGAEDTPALKSDENHHYNPLLRPHWHEHLAMVQLLVAMWSGKHGLPDSLGYSSALEVRAWLSLWRSEVADSAPEESFLPLVKGRNMRISPAGSITHMGLGEEAGGAWDFVLRWFAHISVNY